MHCYVAVECYSATKPLGGQQERNMFKDTKVGFKEASFILLGMEAESVFQATG